MIVLSQGPTIHCIVMGRISSHIHLQGRGWQPTSTTESTTPIVHLRGSSRWEEQSIVNRLHPKARARLVERALAWVKVSSTADGQNTQVCHVSFKNHTWRFPDLDVGATRRQAPEKGGPSSEWCSRRGCHEEHEFRKPGPARLHSLPGRQQSPRTRQVCLGLPPKCCAWHRWHYWTTSVDIAFPRDHAVTPVARRARSVAKRSSCFNLELVLPLCILIP